MAREQAQATFMLFAEDLTDLVDQDMPDTVTDDRELSASVGEAVRNERSMITSKVGTASGGINTATMSRNTGGTGIAGRSTTKVESPVAGIGPAGGARREGTSGKASRSREEIELVFDRNKGAIFALYNRALRNDPTLEGKLVLRLTIAPNCTVTMCEIVSSELDVDKMDYLLRDMTDKTGCFYSSEDADSEGVEGKFYVWSKKELLTRRSSRAERSASWVMIFTESLCGIIRRVH